MKQALQKDQNPHYTAELNPLDLPATIMEMMIQQLLGAERFPWTMSAVENI